MDDDSRPRGHLEKPPADKSSADQLPANPPSPEEPSLVMPPAGMPSAAGLPAGRQPAAGLPASTGQDRRERRTRPPEPEPVYAALLRASGLQPPPGQHQASDDLSAGPAGARAARPASGRPGTATSTASGRRLRLLPGGLQNDSLASGDAAASGWPLNEMASHPSPTRPYRHLDDPGQSALPGGHAVRGDRAAAGGLAVAGPPAVADDQAVAGGPAFLACPVGQGHQAGPAGPAGPVLPGATRPAGGTGASGWRTFGQASPLDRRPASYWAIAWDYAGARGRSAGRHRRFTDRGPRWRRTLMLGGS